MFGDAIGEVIEFEFKPKVMNLEPILEKPIAYSRHKRDWIKQYMAKLEELGIVKLVKPGEKGPQFAVGVVLVREG